MSKLDPKYIGKLPPGASVELRQSLVEYRKLNKQGFLKGVRILPGPGCAVSEAQDGVVYAMEGVPGLPFKNCDRDPCCACCYSPILK